MMISKIKKSIISKKKNDLFSLYSSSHLSKLKIQVLSLTNEKILILSGDPNSINSEIIYKAWKKLSNRLKKVYIISNYELFNSQLKRIGLAQNTQKVDNLHSSYRKLY